jgi:hypothetical protein
MAGRDEAAMGCCAPGKKAAQPRRSKAPTAQLSFISAARLFSRDLRHKCQDCETRIPSER